MPRPRVYPVASFGPEIMQALLRGAESRFEIGPLPYRKAVSFQQRVNALRRAMRDSEHPEYALVAKTKVSIVWGERAGLPPVEQKFSSRNVAFPRDSDTPAKLIIEPYDKEFSEVLIKSGIEADKLKSDPLADFTPSRSDTLPSDDYLDQVLNSKKPPGV